MVLSAGQRVAHYEIVSAVGAGGTGEVYRVHDAKLKREHLPDGKHFIMVLETRRG
jgi:hypothetical protein